MGVKDVAKQIERTGMQIPGFRKNPKVLEKILENYILPVTYFGAFVGLLAAGADLWDRRKRHGTGLLLQVILRTSNRFRRNKRWKCTRCSVSSSASHDQCTVCSALGRSFAVHDRVRTPRFILCHQRSQRSPNVGEQYLDSARFHHLDIGGLPVGCSRCAERRWRQSPGVMIAAITAQ